jgi:hypothetical protein
MPDVTPPDTERKTDAYEAHHMSEGNVVFRSKMRMPLWWFAALIVGAAFFMSAGLVRGHWITYVEAGLFVLIVIFFSVLRVAVSSEFVHVQLGLLGPKIPVGSIEQVATQAYDAMRYGGWGLRRSRDGTTAYSLPGGRREAVRIVYRDARQRLSTVVVSSDQAAALAAAIESARSPWRRHAAASEGAGSERAIPDVAATSLSEAANDPPSSPSARQRQG